MSRTDFKKTFSVILGRVGNPVQDKFVNKYPTFERLSEKDARKYVEKFITDLTAGYKKDLENVLRNEKYDKNNPPTIYSIIPSNVQNFLREATSAVRGGRSKRQVRVGAGSKEDENMFTCPDPVVVETSWNDIAGQASVKSDIKMQYIYPYQFLQLFKEKSKGVLFYGPPGVGKTLLARAASQELKGSVMIAPSPGQLKGKFEGDTEKFIDGVFKCAAEELEDGAKAAIIFIDEFEGIAGKRTSENPGMTRSVNAFLQGMDGMKSVTGVSVLAATNYPWKLDDAVLRRFSARIFVDLPDSIAREYLIRKNLAKNYSCPNVNVKKDVIPNLMNTNKYIRNIKKYGGEPNIKVPGFLGKSDAPDYVDEAFVKEITTKPYPNGTAPTSTGDDLKKRILNDDKIDAEAETKDQGFMFGYSGSDIDKMMEIAIRNAAMRSLNGVLPDLVLQPGESVPGGKFKHVKFGGSLETEDCNFKDADEDIGRDDWYLYTPADATDGTREGKYLALTMSNSHQSKCISFDLRKSDIKKALKEYKPTFTDCSYVEVLIYSVKNKPGGQCPEIS